MEQAAERQRSVRVAELGIERDRLLGGGLRARESVAAAAIRP